MKLHFDRERVRQLLDHAKAAPEHDQTFGATEKQGPGLLFVADQGIYLMSNGIPRLDATEHENVAYAKECDPVAMPFDEWWANKHAAAGGDDSVEYVPADLVEGALRLSGPVVIDSTPKTFAVIVKAGPSSTTVGNLPGMPQRGAGPGRGGRR